MSAGNSTLVQRLRHGIGTIDTDRDAAADAIEKLREALQTLMAVDVKGHTLADRLQFSDSGRAILSQCRNALETTQ